MAGNKKEEKCCKGLLDWKSYVLPVTRDNVLYYYVPLVGASCFVATSVHITRPNLFRGILQHRDPTSTLLTGSFIGHSLYMYGRKHLKGQSAQYRIGYSLMGSGMFNFGSLLFWAMLRSGISAAVKTDSGAALKIVLAIGSSIIFLRAGCDYLALVDSYVK